MTEVLVVLALLVFLGWLLWPERRPVRPKVAAEPDGLDGCDPRVREAIERGYSDAALIQAAEDVAVRDHAAVSLPHVTATTPRVTYWLTPKCDDCEFDVASSLDGEVAIPIRTFTCPRHREER